MKSSTHPPFRLLLLTALLCSSCVKQLLPGNSMSDPAISGETRVKELLSHLSQKPVESPQAAQAPEAGAKTSAPLSLSLQEAIVDGLSGNQAFKVERFKPSLSRAHEEVERAAFDPLLTATTGRIRGEGSASALSHDLSTAGKLGEVDETRTGVGVKQMTTLGGSLEAKAVEDRQDLEDVQDRHGVERSWDVTITQALLQGRGPDVTLARLRQSRLDTEMSLYELQGAAEALVSQIEQGYWNFILARRALDIYRQSLAIAKAQTAEVMERIKLGGLAESEGAAAQAEQAARYQQTVAAEGALAKAKLNLLRLVNPNGHPDWQADIEPADAPELPDLALDKVDSHVALALARRPDLNQAKLMVQRREIEVVTTKNGLLPKLDLFVSLGGSHYSDSFLGQADNKGSQKLYGGGLTLSLPLGNREAKARRAAAGWSLDQANAALANMEQLVQVDVRSAYVDVEQAQAQAQAAAATCALRQKTQELEQEKFRLGRATTLEVAQAQRDLVTSQIAQAQAVVGVRQALVTLYRLEGSLLSHRGIVP